MSFRVARPIIYFIMVCIDVEFLSQNGCLLPPDNSREPSDHIWVIASPSWKLGKGRNCWGGLKSWRVLLNRLIIWKLFEIMKMFNFHDVFDLWRQSAYVPFLTVYTNAVSTVSSLNSATSTEIDCLDKQKKIHFFIMLTYLSGPILLTLWLMKYI